MRRNNLGGLFLHGNAGAKMTTETENHVLDRVLELLAVRAKSKGPLKSDTRIPVSYTHLTLPTKA